MIPSSREQLETLAERCAQETSLFFSQGGDAGESCLELFELALLHGNEAAWEILYQQYQPLVKGWVLQHPVFHQTGEEADFFVNVAFSRMWQAITPEKFQRFDGIKSILRYLQICVHSAIVDAIRQRQREWLDIDAPDVRTELAVEGNGIEDRVSHALYCQQVLEAVKDRLKSPLERLVLNEVYVLGQKPREIYRRYPHLFNDVKDIYRIKENILARLRRDKELLETIR
jgi:DNA-directed RNA polymerase specialized sigma24 family protein